MKKGQGQLFYTACGIEITTHCKPGFFMLDAESTLVLTAKEAIGFAANPLLI